MKAKYKVTTAFGMQSIGKIIPCFVLNIDEDSDEALIYHPPNPKKYECGSFELCKLNDENHYVSISEKHYVNEGRKCEGFSKFLKNLK